MLLAEMGKLAEAARLELAPYCVPDYCRIAGSIRRKKPEPGDIEIVCIPASPRLFEFVDTVNKWQKIKGTAKGKYAQRVYQGVKLDLFIVAPQTWACLYTIRTGSDAFSHALAIRARQVGLCFRNGQLWHLAPKDATGLFPLEDINEEIDVFRALGIKWVEPEMRLTGREIAEYDPRK